MYQAILLAAGDSTRSKLNYNKVLHKVNNVPIIKLSINNFMLDDRCNRIFLVCKIEEIDTFKKLFTNNEKIEFVIGGKTRQESVNNALKCVNSEYVLIHDGARPYYSKHLLDSILDKLNNYNCVIPSLSITDTIKEVKDNIVIKTIKRETVRTVQTPQGFKTSVIKKAHALATSNNYTDDASIVEELLEDVIYTVEGEKENIKYTIKEDF